MSWIGFPFESWYALQRMFPVLVVDEHRLARGRPAVQPTTARTSCPSVNVAGMNFGMRVELTEVLELLLRLGEGGARRLAEARLPPVGHVLAQAVEAGEDADARVLVHAIEHRAERRVVLRVLGDEDELLDRARPSGNRSRARPRSAGCAGASTPAGRGGRCWGRRGGAPVLERAAAREDREVLQDDGVGERAEDLVGGDAALDEVDDVGLGEDAALGRDVVELRVVEVEAGHHLRRRVHLEEALVDGGARARRALVVHGPPWRSSRPPSRPS